MADLAVPDAPAEAAPSATRMQQLAAQYYAAHPAAPLPEGLTAQERADFIMNERPVQGRTPAAWLDAAHAFRLGEASVAPSAARLDLAVLQAYEAVGVAPSPADLLAAQANAAKIPLPLQAAVADLLGTVAQAYAEQALLAKAVAPRLDATEDVTLLQPAERDAMVERAGRIVDAADAFRARWNLLAPLGVGLAAPTCLAPVGADCLAYLGSSGADTYAPNPFPLPDPILIADPDGADTYTNSAGGANPLGAFVPGNGIGGGNGIALSVVVDLNGNDLYSYTGEPSVVQGSGSVGGLGVLVDAWGDDVYYSDFVRAFTPPVASVFPGYYQDGGSQGHGYGGFGLLLDAWGDDVYDSRISSTQGRCVWALSQGWGGDGGVGISSDLWGTDEWLSRGGPLLGTHDCFGIGGGATVNDAFIGIYNQGTGFDGVGIMTDTGAGDDVYLDWLNGTSTDYYAQGFGAFGGLGILYEDGGNDVYVAEEHATSAVIDPLLNCAFGTGSLGGTGILIDQAGDDWYYANTTSVNKGAVTMVQGAGDIGAAYGLFVDADGTDVHEAYAGSAPGVFGRGKFHATYSIVGTFLDLGGDADTYIPAGLGANDAVWVFGADR